MRHGEPRRVQERTLQTAHCRESWRRLSPHPAVQLVADDGMPGFGEVDTDLVSATGADSHADERHAAERLDLEDARAGRARAPGAARHLLAVARIAADRPVHHHEARRPPDERQILLADFTIVKLPRQRSV